MAVIIREDEFYRYFDLVMELWPHQLTLDVGSQDAFSTLSESCLKSTFMRIHADLYANVEDWDLQVGSAITKAIYKFLCLKSDAKFGTKLSRDCIDKKAVMNIMDQYPAWSVVREKAY